MKFEHVMWELMHGKRIRRTSWPNDVYVRYSDPYRTFFQHTSDEMIRLEGITLNNEWMTAEDWTVVI
jgi:hypothetical protein